MPKIEDKIIKVNEIFNSIQGEGMTAGRPATFVRLQGCNLTCDFCDTKYTWNMNSKKAKEYSLREIRELSLQRIVLTGGEPLLQINGRDLDYLVYADDNYKFIEVETNGTCVPDILTNREIVQFNVSPKFGDINIDSLRTFTTIFAIFKFVIENEKEIEETKRIVKEAGIDNINVWLMPKSLKRADQIELLSWLVKICMENNWNLSPRLQNIIWDGKRGV